MAYDFLVPGDPLTPGWASTTGARRIDAATSALVAAHHQRAALVQDARVLLEAIGGPEAPAAWRGALPVTYRVGGGPLVVHMRVRSDDRVRPIWTVTGDDPRQRAAGPAGDRRQPPRCVDLRRRRSRRAGRRR